MLVSCVACTDGKGTGSIYPLPVQKQGSDAFMTPSPLLTLSPPKTMENAVRIWDDVGMVGSTCCPPLGHVEISRKK